MLTTAGTIGFYDQAEITSVFLHEPSSKRNTNLFTIIVFEEKIGSEVPRKQGFLTEKLWDSGVDNLKVGIIRKIVTLPEAEDLFAGLCERSAWELEGNKLDCPVLRPIPKVFVPASAKVPMRRILKNNIFGGSYVLEFFDEEKASLRQFRSDPKLLRRTSEFIQRYVPLELDVINERIGNFVFQFPITILSFAASGKEGWNGVQARLAFHPLMSPEREFGMAAISNLDASVLGLGMTTISSKDESVTIVSGNSMYENHIVVTDPNHPLLLASQDGAFIRKFEFQMAVGGAFSEPRTIRIPYGNSKTGPGSETKISLHSEVSDSHRTFVEYGGQILGRLYEDERKAAIRNLTFKQYGLTGNEFEIAIKDVRTLIERYGRFAAYLWDSYLDAIDIMRTLYFNPMQTARMRALRSFSAQKRPDASEPNLLSNFFECTDGPLSEYEHWRTRQSQEFKNRSNNIGINIEFRCQHSTYGRPFHDRFLIFPANPADAASKAIAYSLGSSINNIGASHCILQEVTNPQFIVDAFEEYWNSVSHPSCLVWKNEH